ncbi:MAG: [LysW]-aminoadipate kinase [Candidatus Dormibacteria bacterium]
MSAPLVIKIGGSVENPAHLLDGIAAHRGPVVVVHGAHRVLDDLAVRLGHPPRFVTSRTGATSRYTDAESMDHFLMAYCGVVNKRLVQELLKRGVRAAGLAAMDGGTVRGRRRSHIRAVDNGRTIILHGDHAGSIDSVDAVLLTALLDHGVTPVVCPPAFGDDGVPINVDGDRLTAELAIALRAERMVIFSDTPGFLRDVDDPTSVVRDAALGDIDALTPAATGRARAKLAAVERALRGGVDAAGLCDGSHAGARGAALDGAGTWFRAAATVTS